MRRKFAWGSIVFTVLLATNVHAQSLKLDPPLTYRATLLTGRSPVIVRPLNQTVDLLLQLAGGQLGRALPTVNGRVVDVPNVALAGLAANSVIQKLSLDRETVGLNERTGATVGATAIRQALGYDGSGIGIAIVDSGVTGYHDDLADPAVLGSQRVAQFVDFVNGRSAAYDDYGHGSHVAGIIAGNGFDSSGARSGIAPCARLVVLKTLNSSGNGRISDVIAALDYAVSHKDQFNIRVVNLSIAAGVYESYSSDFLAQATKHAVQNGLVVVAAAGNLGRSANGQTQYGGITAPGNAPWVLTVGASSHMGTVTRDDDVMATFSSRGPTRYDYAAKPDLVAPGVGIESLSAPGSTFYSRYSAYLLGGTTGTSYPPYLSLSGTSMATPVVAGTVALMLQANPALTPNAVKAILQYTAQQYAGYDALTEGAGFLNAAGAVTLARFFGQTSGEYPYDATWSRQIIWGNHRFAGGRLMPSVNAWMLSLAWGSSPDNSDAVVWGDVWSESSAGWATWSSGASASSNASSNVVWGSQCGGEDCQATAWSTSDSETVVWGTNDSETVVWGTNGDETVVWGTDCGQDCHPVIWP